jgi:hypothetical protein
LLHSAWIIKRWRTGDEPMNTVNHPQIRPWMVFIALLLLASFAALAFWVIWQFFTVDRGMVIRRLDNETSRFASKLFFDKMAVLAQLAIALIGGTWAFLTLANTTVRIKSWTTIICFTLANLSLVSSLAFYLYGYDFIVARIFYHASFDIDAPFICFVSKSQQWLFIKGCIDLVMTIILGRQMS